MSRIHVNHALLRTGLLVAVGLLAAFGAAASTAVRSTIPPRVGVLPPAQPQPDSGLYTSYYFWGGYTAISWLVCGSTAESEGCYGGGSLSPFGHVGALIEGDEVVLASNPVVGLQTHTVRRKVFIVDDADGDGSAVKLYVYMKTDVVDSSDDTTTFTLQNTVDLPLTGGADVKTFIAADSGYLFIGTTRSGAVRVNKTDLTVDEVGGFSGSEPIYVSSISANKYGYVTVTFGGGGVENGFYIFSPDGSGDGDGGGADFVVGTQNGVSTANIESPAVAPNLAARMKITFKKVPLQNQQKN